MHRAVARACSRSSERLALSMVGTRTGMTVILAFSRVSSTPVWIAKVATRAETSLRLERERRILEWLGPWRGALGLPAIVDYDRDNAGSACLIAGGMPGIARHLTLGAESGLARDGRALAEVLGWLRRFREVVPVSLLESQLGRGDRRTLGESGQDPEELVRLDDLCEGLPLPRLCASHGDFWSGNFLFEGKKLSVIDWDGLSARSPFHDLFSLFTNSSYRVAGAIQTDVTVARFTELYFSAGPGAQYAQSVMRELKPEAEELRSAFYHFVAHSLRIKGGHYRDTWIEIARMLEMRGYPSPFSVE